MQTTVTAYFLSKQLLLFVFAVEVKDKQLFVFAVEVNGKQQ